MHQSAVHCVLTYVLKISIYISSQRIEVKLSELHSSIDIDGMVVDPPLSPTLSTATMRSRKRKKMRIL